MSFLSRVTHAKQTNTTMRTTTVYKCGSPSPQELCRFLSEYSALLLGCGATCIRLENNVQRIAEAYGKEISMVIMPRHVQISVWEKGNDEAVTAISTVKSSPISFNVNTRLSELSWEVADGKTDSNQAAERLGKIVKDDRQDKWTVPVLVALANASFCRLFSGDAVAMLTVLAATLAGYSLKTFLLGRGTDNRLAFFICSFVSSVLGATDILFAIGDTPTTAMATSVLYLVPGIPYLNSFSDMLCRHYICAFCRFMDAIVLTGCLSAGLCCGMLLMNVGMF